MSSDYAKRMAMALGLIVLISLALSAMPLNSERLASFEAERVHGALTEAVKEKEIRNSLDCRLVIRGGKLDELAGRIEELGAVNSGNPEGPPCLITISVTGALYEAVIEGEDLPTIRVFKPRVLWFALLPALLAVTLAVATRRLIPALAVGVLSGATLMGADGSFFGPLSGASAGAAGLLWGVMTSRFHFWIFLFTFSLIGMVNVSTASGGMAGLADWLGRLAKNARSTQIATALLGLAIFFDDYSNTIVVGSSMRSLSDKAKISREKLAYIVDCTAAPVAGLALVSTWIGYEVSLIGDAMSELKLAGSPYAMFLSTIPFRFYCILTLGFVFLNVFIGRDFGPMRRAEMRARSGGGLLRPGSQPLSGAGARKVIGKPMALNALLPVAVVVFATLFGMAANGAGILGPGGVDLAAIKSFDFSRLLSFEDNYIVLCEDGPWVLAMASLMGSALAVFMGGVFGGAPFVKLAKAWFGAGRLLLMAFSVLILAWCIGDVNGSLGTGPFLVCTLADKLPPWLLPVLIFFLASIISFSTGSSWGTMAVLLPAAVPLAYHVGGLPLMAVSLGAVLDGAIFGDHSSPLSDTTIMSSIAAGSDHLDHVRTQLPYALAVATGAVAFGYLEATFLNPLVSYFLALSAFAVLLRFLGRRIEGTGINN